MLSVLLSSNFINITLYIFLYLPVLITLNISVILIMYLKAQKKIYYADENIVYTLG